MLTEEAKRDQATLEALGLSRLPICLAKAHLSLSDNPELRGRPREVALHITGMRPCAGAGFNVVFAGAVLTMPGLPAAPAAWNIDVVCDAEGEEHIVGML